MEIKIFAVGKIKDDWIKKGTEEYRKRISRFSKITITEIPDSPETGDLEKDKGNEGEKLLSFIDEKDFVVALDIGGKETDSREFARNLIKWMETGSSRIVFLIAGSNGYSSKVLERANRKVCFSKLTFPHQLFRIILLEQIFRGFKISRGEKYHK